MRVLEYFSNTQSILLKSIVGPVGENKLLKVRQIKSKYEYLCPQGS